MTNFHEHIFWLNRLFLQKKYFQYFDRSKTRRDRAKFGLAGQQDRPLSKNYLQPWDVALVSIHRISSLPGLQIVVQTILQSVPGES